MSNQELELIFESQLKRSEKKVVNPTKTMMMSILEECGFEGTWEIRDSRRIRKKARDRFGVMRIESRAGSKSVRLWCKPAGNDTAFEYSLFPPAGVDIQMAFSVLGRVHPITLRVAESDTLPIAVLGRVLDMPPIPQALNEVVEVSHFDDPGFSGSGVAGEIQSSRESVARSLDNLAFAIDHIKKNPSDSDDEVYQAMLSEGLVGADRGTVESARAVVGKSKVVKQEVRKEPEGPIPLQMDPSSEPSDEISMDRVLVAIALVAHGGYASSDEAAGSLVRNLSIGPYATKRGFETLKGAIKATISATMKIGGYLEKVSGDSGGPAEKAKGCRITQAGFKRLESIKGKFGEEVESRLSAAMERPPEATVAQVAQVVFPDAIVRLKAMVASYEEAEKQVREIGSLLEPMVAEIGLLEEEIRSCEAEGLRISKEIEALGRDADRNRDRMDEVRKRLSQKIAEKKEWEEMRRPYEKEVEKVGSVLSSLGVGK